MQFYKSYSFPVTPLEFKVDDWSIRISKNGCKTAYSFPRVVRLQYQTNARGRSLMWRKSSESMSTKQTGSFPDCVFTPAANINNRSLFPCQEPPIAMATWQCVVTSKLIEPQILLLYLKVCGKLSYEIRVLLLRALIFISFKS